MSEISVIEVKTSKDLMNFIKFPMELYKNSKNYVPSLINEEKNIWNPAENPALGYSEAKQFLAYKNGKIVGRIAIMINHKEEKELGISKVRFGWLDFIDDFEVSKTLINTAISFAKEKLSYFRVEAEFKERHESILPGMTGQAKIEVGKKNIIWIFQKYLKLLNLKSRYWKILKIMSYLMIFSLMKFLKWGFIKILKILMLLVVKVKN